MLAAVVKVDEFLVKHICFEFITMHNSDSDAEFDAQ